MRSSDYFFWKCSSECVRTSDKFWKSVNILLRYEVMKLELTSMDHPVHYTEDYYEDIFALWPEESTLRRVIIVYNIMAIIPLFMFTELAIVCACCVLMVT